MKKVAEFTFYLKPWVVVEFPWGTAVKNETTGKYHNLFISPQGIEMDVSELNVILHDNGIEFV